MLFGDVSVWGCLGVAWSLCDVVVVVAKRYGWFDRLYAPGVVHQDVVLVIVMEVCIRRVAHATQDLHAEFHGIEFSCFGSPCCQVLMLVLLGAPPREPEDHVLRVGDPLRRLQGRHWAPIGAWRGQPEFTLMRRHSTYIRVSHQIGHRIPIPARSGSRVFVEEHRPFSVLIS